MVRKALAVAVLATIGLFFGGDTAARGQSTADVLVVVRNNSPYTIQIGISSIPNKTLAPGREFSVRRMVWFRDPVNYIQGSQSIPVSVRYNGVTRTGSIPIYARGGQPYSFGGVIRRSPGVLGVVNAGSP